MLQGAISTGNAVAKTKLTNINTACTFNNEDRIKSAHTLAALPFKNNLGLVLAASFISVCLAIKKAPTTIPR